MACPWAAARPRAVHAASFARRVGSKPGQAPPPPTGTAARPRHRPRAPQPGPVAAHRYGRALRTLRRFPHQWRSRNSRLSLLLAAPLVFQAPSGPAAREARASLRSAPRLEARPCPPDPPAPSTPVGPGRGRAPQRCPSKPGQAPPPPINFARNSPATCSNIEFASLELQRFRMVSKNYRLKLCAKFVWVRLSTPSGAAARPGLNARPCSPAPPVLPGSAASLAMGVLHH